LLGAVQKIAAFLLLVALAYSAVSIAAQISRADAVAIALREAGCPKIENCDVRGGLKDGKWVFVVWFVMGRDADGSPQFAPGGWVGLTLNAEGVVIDCTPGA
jgi:hypothetical protein